MAEKLKQDVSLVQDQLAVSAQEHSFFLSKLNNDVDLLCDILYQGRNQLLLSDQVGACPSKKSHPFCSRIDTLLRQLIVYTKFAKFIKYFRHTGKCNASAKNLKK